MRQSCLYEGRPPKGGGGGGILAIWGEDARRAWLRSISNPKRYHPYEYMQTTYN